MKKNIIYSVLLVLICLMLTGCKTDSMEDITIYTTSYPIEYITKKLYGNHSIVHSIYPDEVIELSDKLISDYSMSDLYVYNRLNENEKNYAVKMLNNNKELKIVNATDGITLEYSEEELWLNPNNFLMLCLNVSNGMKKYITNAILRKEIDEEYNKLKVEISELDAEISLLVKNADHKSILVSNDLFEFMTKYDLNVYSLGSENISSKTYEDIKTAIEKDKIKYIIMLDDDELSKEADNFIADNHLEKIHFNSLTTLDTEDRNVGKDYLSIMRDNLDMLKKELYEEEK